MEPDTTIAYYNEHAKEYFDNTLFVDMATSYSMFIKYLKPHSSIVDLGAGSGRDVLYFKKMGFQVEGIDASEKMCLLATEYSGVKIECKAIQEWHPNRKYDGVWANASLLHLSKSEFERFLLNIDDYLLDKGVLYFSLKNGVATGLDEQGRYFVNYNFEDINCMIRKNCNLKLVEKWTSFDTLKRVGFKWINIIVQRQ